jgi:hypothetical protein
MDSSRSGPRQHRSIVGEEGGDDGAGERGQAVGHLKGAGDAMGDIMGFMLVEVVYDDGGGWCQGDGVGNMQSLCLTPPPLSSRSRSRALSPLHA